MSGVIRELAREKTSDGKELLGDFGISDRSTDPELKQLLSSTVYSLNAIFESIISPLSFQHLHSQLLLKMVDLAEYALAD